MFSRRRSLLLLAVVAGSASCRTPDPAAVSDLSLDEPLPYVIGVALPEELQEPTMVDEAQSRRPLTVDVGRLEQALARAAGESAVCTELVFLNSSSNDAAAAVSEARSRGADVLVRLIASGPPTYRFSHRNWWFLPNTLLWFFLGFPSFWIEDRVYDVEWETTFKLFNVAAGSDFPKDYRFEMEKEQGLSLADQGWTASVLWTPPGFYEGPYTPETLVPLLESWLVRTFVEFLHRHGRDEGFPSAVRVTVRSPSNSSTVSGPDVPLRYSISTPSVLSRLLIQVDGATVLEKDALTMPRSRRIAGAHVYRRRLTLRDLESGDHVLRIKVLRTGEVAESGRADGVRWSTTQTLRFRVGAPGRSARAARATR